jgi:hypothetical protein
LSSLTNWNELYFRLSSSGLQDPRWHADNFAIQKVDDVSAALKFLEKQDTYRANVSSIATAKLGTVVVGALGGKKSNVSVDDFLPFDTRKLKKDTGVTDQSMRVLRRLMRTRKLDPRLVATLASEIKNASLREDE